MEERKATTKSLTLAPTAVAIMVLILIILVAVICEPGLINKLQGSINPGTQSTYDLGHYLNLAANPKCWAFYPLWPNVIHAVNQLTGANAARSAIGTSIIFFVGSLALANSWLKKNASTYSSFKTTWLLIVLSPMSVFMLNGYSEALFSLLSWLLIILATAFFDSEAPIALEKPKVPGKPLLAVLIIVISIFIGYCRPSLPQVVVAIAVTMLAERIYTNDTSSTVKSKTASLSLIILIGCMLGYSLYGMQCVREGGIFLQPFASQSNDWDKSVGFRPWFLLSTRSPIYDLWGLYYPVALLALGASTLAPRIKDITSAVSSRKDWFSYLFLVYPPASLTLALLINLRNKTRSDKYFLTVEAASNRAAEVFELEKFRFIFFYSISFSAAHSAIVFLTQENYLYSLGRYIFGQPYFYVALSIYLPAMYSSAPKRMHNISTVSILLSGFLLLDQLIKYGRNTWAG